MSVAATVLSVLLALVSLAAGAPKTLLKGPASAGLQQAGLSADLIRFIGLAEVAAAVGLMVGVFWAPLGIAAAIGFAAIMVGAIAFHAKAGDYANPETRGGAVAPIVLALLAAATAITLGPAA